MNIEIFSVPKEQDEWAVIRALEPRIHEDSDPARKVNFKVKLNPNTVAGVGHDGTGTLTLPSQPLGRRFLDQIRDSPVKMAVGDAKAHKLRFKKSNKRPPDYLIKTLDKTPFVSPDVEEKHAKILADLDAGVRVESLQLGLYYRPLGSKGRAFSIEWPAREYTEDAATSKLKFEYDRKLIRITVSRWLHLGLAR
jgi:RNA-dependent RNA polymerase